MAMELSDSWYEYFAQGRAQTQAPQEVDPLRDYDRLANFIIARRGSAVLSCAKRSGIDLQDPGVRAEVVNHTALVRAQRTVGTDYFENADLWLPRD